MDLRGFIEVTELSNRDLIAAAYNMSHPKGMGFMHFTEGPLTDEELDALVAHYKKYDIRGGVHLDYVKGRQCKFRVLAQDDKKYIELDWYDHSPEDTKELVRQLLLPDVENRINKATLELEEKRQGRGV